MILKYPPYLFFCLFSDTHRSFKLRLPSIRRDIRFKSKVVDNSPDPENPPIPEIPEDAVPLNQLLQTDSLLPVNSSPNKSPERLYRSENTYSEVLNETENNSLQLPTVTFIRRASSLEGLDLKSQDKYDKLGQGDSGKDLDFMYLFVPTWQNKQNDQCAQQRLRLAGTCT